MRSLLFLVLSGVLLGLFGCGREEPAMLRTEGVIMGTVYHVTWVPAAVTSSEGAADESEKRLATEEVRIGEGIYRELNQVDEAMSTYKADSELSRFNQAPINSWITVSEPLGAVLDMASRINQESGGAFDVTVGPLVNLWGFGPERKEDRVPTAEEIETVRALVGQSLLQKDETGRLLRSAPIYIDLSAIAKGYAVDRVAAYLEGQGIARYLVEVGGEIRLKGPKSNGEPWRIAIESPEGLRNIFSTLASNDLALATSGDYRNYFEKDGVRYSHTIDPRTGAPIRHGLASVSVLAESTALADGWATAMMVLGPEEGRALAERLNLAVYFIIKAGEGFSDWASLEFLRRVESVEKR